MSIKKNVLAVALVVGLGMTGAASAYTMTTNGNATPEKVATSDITSASTVVTMTESIEVKIDNLDFIVGRTTGFNVRVELNNGAKFAANPAPTPGGQLPAGWTVTRVAGGAGQTYAVFSVNPPSTNPVPGIQPGTIFTIAGAQLTNLTTLQTSGATIVGTARFIDPVGASEIGSAVTPLLQSGNPVQLSCDANAGDTATRIDVGQNESHGSKTYFSSTGAIGYLDENTIDLGDVTVDADPAFASFAYTGTDEFTTTVTGDVSAFFAAGNSLYLSNDNCASPISADVTTNESTGTTTFTYTAADAGFDGTGGALQLCGQVAGDNTTVIDASSISVRTVFSRSGTPDVNGASCSLLPLQYNGSVIRVYNVNPAGNSTAQSFVRVINQSTTSGRVSIVGIDDNGVQRGPVVFNLGALKSMQVNSEDLEAGNAAKGLSGSLGDGAGKWRLFVTGEFSGMVVQSLNRNATDGTVTNLTDADTRGEQLWHDVVENEGFGPL
ncbi:hypothetical protein [Cognatilysobacter segetis]|uniref:hypothetical protein n=1 Tax=Cognatilysobacter segetis TaxID=2492394 RepID=UPI00105DF5A3|nr:hypothetical protein [Lysobacter segetis]